MLLLGIGLHWVTLLGLRVTNLSILLLLTIIIISRAIFRVVIVSVLVLLIGRGRHYEVEGAAAELVSNESATAAH